MFFFFYEATVVCQGEVLQVQFTSTGTWEQPSSLHVHTASSWMTN